MPGCKSAAECHLFKLFLTQHQSFHLLCCLLQCVHAYACTLTFVLQLHPTFSSPLHRNAQKPFSPVVSFSKLSYSQSNVWLGLFCNLPCCIRFAVLPCYDLLDLKAQESSLHNMRGKV